MGKEKQAQSWKWCQLAPKEASMTRKAATLEAWGIFVAQMPGVCHRTNHTPSAARSLRSAVASHITLPDNRAKYLEEMHDHEGCVAPVSLGKVARKA